MGNVVLYCGYHKHNEHHEELKKLQQSTIALLAQECRAKDGEVILMFEPGLCH